jgi:hypothetical protein
MAVVDQVAAEGAADGEALSEARPEWDRSVKISYILLIL